MRRSVGNRRISKQALALDPSSIEVFQEGSHFYDAVAPNAQKARQYAETGREEAAKIIVEMDAIIERQSETR